MRIFLAGIMQGSHRAAELHNQDYRQRVRELFAQYWPGSEVYDPLADHRDSLEYQDARAKEVFLFHNRMCGEVDLVVAFVPEATMGTAIEMWEAHRHGRAVATISPLVHNWVVKYCSTWVFANVTEFETAVSSGRFASDFASHQRQK